MQRRRLFSIITIGVFAFVLYIILLHILPGLAKRTADYSFAIAAARFLTALGLSSLFVALALKKIKISLYWLIALLSGITLFAIPTSLSPLLPKYPTLALGAFAFGGILTLFAWLLKEDAKHPRRNIAWALLLCVGLTCALGGLQVLLFLQGMTY